MGFFSRSKARPSGASSKGGPVYDATVDHPATYDTQWGTDGLPTAFAPDPGGLLARRPSIEFLVAPLETPIQHSPATSWFQGTPYPGPPATVTVPVDLDSIRWWGRTGQGRLVWSEHTEFSGNLPPMIPQDMPQHLDVWQRLQAGYPSLSRNRPSSFGAQVPALNPLYSQ